MHNLHPLITITFRLSKAWKAVAGVCTKRGCRYEIALAPKIHTEPFKKFSKQGAGGDDMFCYNPLDCLLQTFYHELVHFIIFTLCPEYDVPGGHSKQFRQIIHNLFGHTDFRHTLGTDIDKQGKWSQASLRKQNVDYIYMDDLKDSEKRVKVKITTLNPT